MQRQSIKRRIKCGATKPLTAFPFDKRTNKYPSRCKSRSIEDLRLKRRRSGMKPQLRQTPDQKERGVKTCSKCLQEKKLEDFRFRQDQGRYTSICKECEHARQREYDATHREQRKAYRQAHKDEFSKRDGEYYRTHKEQIAKRYKEWAKAHAEQLAEYNKQYRTANAEAISKQRQGYAKENRKKITSYYLNKRETDPLFKVSTQVRGLIRISLKKKGYGKDTHTYDILGCDYNTLWEYLKKTWKENYGTEWNGEPYHIDHIIPLATAETEQEIINLCYYKNLQLLKPRDNLVKNKNLNWQLSK